MATDNGKILRALSDENRLAAVRIIAKSDGICARDLLDEIDITQPTLSHHMKVLAESGLIDVIKEGRKRYYTINKDNADEFLDSLADLIDGKD